ncbi:MAG: hypothetical protein CSB13_09185 [Chloroflexi bacterium]|nr:MAG: hypothetical protein CSB13_09185 [Chloroflexota bacterium]
MSYNVGLNLVEVDGKATPSIQPAPTSVTGFIIKSQRGIPGVVRRVTNWTQFKEYFGEYTTSAYGAYNVRGFFDNGGQTAMVTRVANTDGVDATPTTLTSNSGPWNLDSGDTLTIRVDDATDAAITFTDGPASTTGGGGTFDLSTDNVLGFIVNGVATDSYTFLASDTVDGNLVTATVTDVVAVINREFPGIRAFDDGGNLTVRTDRGDSDSSLTATGAAATELGLSTVEVSGSGNVRNIDNIDAAEMVSIITDSIAAAGAMVSQAGSTFVITHNTPGAAGTLEAVAGGVEANFAFTTTAGTDTDVSLNAVAASNTFNAGVTPVLTVTAGYRGQTDVGVWGEDLSIIIETNADNSAWFDLTVNYNGSSVETWSALSMSSSDNNYVQRVINEEFSGSKYIMVTVTGATKPDDVTSPGTALTSGRDGSYASTSAEVNALAAAVDLYDLVEIQLLCCPETDDPALVTKALTHCQNEGDRMFAGHTPQNMEVSSIKSAYSGQFQGDKVYGALYFPWIQINDPIGNRKWVPPTGAILGTYARTERERGIWKAPAGDAAKLSGALDVRYHITDIDHTSLVKNASVNAVRFIPGKGIVIDSSRTLSTNPLWLYVNVRLLFNFVKSSLINGLRWVVQEPHNEALWNKVKYNSVTPFLMGLWRRGAFGPGGPSDVFTVKIDAENNPPASVQQGIFNAELYFFPSRPAETIIITVGQQEGAGSASEG